MILTPKEDKTARKLPYVQKSCTAFQCNVNNQLPSVFQMPRHIFLFRGLVLDDLWIKYFLEPVKELDFYLLTFPTPFHVRTKFHINLDIYGFRDVSNVNEKAQETSNMPLTIYSPYCILIQFSVITFTFKINMPQDRNINAWSGQLQ